MAVRVVPLGGLGEIGLNCMVLESGDTRVVVDCGVMFPSETMFGVDLVIPDFSYLRGKKVDAVIVTHGHEDHIGALPYLMKALGVEEGPSPPVHATPFTRALIHERLAEHGIAGRVDLRVATPREPFDVGPFHTELLKVCHSIVDACGVAFTTPDGRIVHTGDFKIDPTPPDGESFDHEGFTRYGDAGVSLLLSDSTNAERAGHTPSERTVERALEEIFQSAPGRLVIAMFSSHVPRMRQIAALCDRYRRRLVLEGRSMVRNAGIARDLGHLRIPPGLLADAEEGARLPPERLCVLSTGSQAEQRSALSKMALGLHAHLNIRPGDTVVMSSRMIPGNERDVTNLVNQLYRCGAEVIYESLGEVHVSGHACRDELKTMLQLTRPRSFVPVHGEFRHLVHHAQLAKESGVAAANTRIVENGAVLELDQQYGLRVMGAAPAGRVFVDARRVEGMADVLVKDRLDMARTGLVVVVLTLGHAGELVRGPEVFTRGLTSDDFEPALSRRAAGEAAMALQLMPAAARADRGEVADELRRTLRRFFNRELSVKPVVLPLVLAM